MIPSHSADVVTAVGLPSFLPAKAVGPKGEVVPAPAAGLTFAAGAGTFDIVQPSQRSLSHPVVNIVTAAFNPLSSRFLICVGLLALTGCAAHRDPTRPAEPTSASDPPAFVEMTKAAGITHTHAKPILDAQLNNIMNWMASVGAAAATADFDRDGWLDLYVVNSRKTFPNYLYRNNGDGTFTDVAPTAGLANLNDEGGVGMDAVWGDYDNDGWPDLYLVRWGTDRLFHNQGDGTFTEVTGQLFRKRDGTPGIDWANGNGAVFIDYNLDGRLDLYVGNYFDEVDLWNLKTTRIMHDDFEKARNAGPNSFYRQEPDGTFSEIGRDLGLDNPGWTLGVGSADLNNDGHPDLYCADDFGPDQLFLNLGNGHFTNATEFAIGFDTKKGMNVECGDVDRDGWMDIYVSNITTAEYLQEGNMLWHNNGPGPGGAVSFTDIALETGTYDGGWGWGAKFLDYDNDGDLDIIAVNGFISAGQGNYWYDLASWTVTDQDPADARNWPPIGDRSFSGYEKTRFWRQDGPYLFSERAADLGMDSDRDGRGVVCFDYDNDGDIDVFVANQDQPPQLFNNQTRRQGHWLTIELEADPAAGVNRDAIGTRVTVVTRQDRQIAERDGGNGYAGQSDPRLHFGLGTEKRVDLLEVRWPDGGLQYLENVPADQFITIRQDRSQYATRLATGNTAPNPWKHEREAAQRIVPRLDPAELESLLGEMESRMRKSLDSFHLPSIYRARCVEHSQHDRAIRFFKDLVAANPEAARPRLELSCAYIDKIPTCGGMAAIVSKGTLARKALDQLDQVIADDPNSWIAFYARGVNHLNWPRALRHSDDAVADFTRCIELQQGQGAGDVRSYYRRVYIGLGDAYTKDRRISEARRAWREGLTLFPADEALQTRLQIENDSALLKYVESQRSLEQPIDTDLSFVE